MKKLKTALEELQSKCIGIANIHNNIELVIESDKHSFSTVWIGKLGGVNTCHYSKSQFQYESFPIQYKTLSEFLNEPIEFHNWYKETFEIN